MYGFLIAGMILGGIIGYFVFYFRYQYRDTVNQLRDHVKQANHELHHLQGEIEEYTAQNILLKEKVTELLEKNDDLTDVVTELSKYYVHIKKAAEKTTELTKFLQEPSPEMEEKLAHLASSFGSGSSSSGYTGKEEKKFF